MQISRIASRRMGMRFTGILAAGAIACVANTYDPHIQIVPLPPGVDPVPLQFRAQIVSRTPGPTHLVSRPGKCNGCMVQVVIGPLGDTREVDPPMGMKKPIPATGRAVAKVINQDPAISEAMYGFQPSTLFEYYVWADTALGAARMTLLEVPAQGQPGVVRAIFQKKLKICEDGHAPPQTSDANFYYCKGVELGGSSLNLHLAGMSLPGSLELGIARLTEVVSKKIVTLPPPLWLGCLSGCCG